MEIREVAQVLIYIHAAFGGIALLAGGIALIAKKGGTLHRKSGKTFYYSMLFSAVLSLIVAVFPYHESSFLFSIGVFSTYFLIGGVRSLRFKKKDVVLKYDKLIAYAIILTGAIMILYPIVLAGKINVVLFVFGAVGLFSGISDIVLFNNRERLREAYLKQHLRRMMGGYIAAVTAFFVVNELLPGMYNWFVPGIIGGGYIAYWMMKLKRITPRSKNL